MIYYMIFWREKISNDLFLAGEVIDPNLNDSSSSISLAIIIIIPILITALLLIALLTFFLIKRSKV